MTTTASPQASTSSCAISSWPGYFAPNSVSWKVLLGPTVIPALTYSGAMFLLNQPMTTIGQQHTVLFKDTRARFKRSYEYFMTVTFGTRKEADSAAQQLNAIHSRITGQWPVGGRVYSASEPDNLLWFLAPFVQGQLEAYEAYGLEPLAAEERDQMWREQTVLAELNEIPTSIWPQSQADADDYFARMRPLLGVNEPGALALAAAYPKLQYSPYFPSALAPLMWVTNEAGTALLPDYALNLIGQQRPAIAKTAAIALYRPLYRQIARTPVVRDAIAASCGDPSRTLVRNARLARGEA
jgi:uncharacterized protein (DUF2236 family)